MWVKLALSLLPVGLYPKVGHQLQANQYVRRNQSIDQSARVQ